MDRKLNTTNNTLIDHLLFNNDAVFFSAHVNAKKAICLVNQAKHHLLGKYSDCQNAAEIKAEKINCMVLSKWAKKINV